MNQPTHAILLLLGLLALPATALAQEGESEADEQVRDRARVILHEARDHAQAGRHAIAAERYLELHVYMTQHGMERAAVALWTAGRSLAELPGREDEAISTLQQFLEDSTSLTEDAEIRDFRSEAVTLIAELEARRGSATEPEEEPPPEEDDENVESERTAQAPSESDSGGISPVGPIVLGVGAATLAVGGVFGALALVRESNLIDRCGGTRCLNTEDNHASYDEMRLFAGASDVLLVAGGLIAATGLVLTFTLEGEGDDEDEPRASATLGPGTVGLALEGSF